MPIITRLERASGWLRHRYAGESTAGYANATVIAEPGIGFASYTANGWTLRPGTYEATVKGGDASGITYRLGGVPGATTTSRDLIFTITELTTLRLYLQTGTPATGAEVWVRITRIA